MSTRSVCLLFQVCVIVANTTITFSQPMPIALHPKNSHYFLYNGKPTILITSAEHYGAVLNRDFDFIMYLDELKANHLNLTRTFSGAYIEPPGAFNISQNTLAPEPGQWVCPWARSNEAAGASVGKKFDLNTWDASYFERLSTFVSEAEKRGIIVELALFCPFYKEDQWILSPMNALNNVNGVGAIAKDDVYTLDKNGGLLVVQERMVTKIVHELQPFGNVIYEICNEPYFGGVRMEWQHHIASLIKENEKGMSNTHLISQNIANDSAKVTSPHPAVSVFNFHYATPPNAVKQNYHLNKVIGNNETGFHGQQDSTYRKEGWEFILAGGALYNNLDYSFTAQHEKGDFSYPEKQPGGGSAALRKQLGFLQEFISGFEFIQMKPDYSFRAGGMFSRARAYALSEPGVQYAAYFLHADKSTISFKLPKGRYTGTWINPVTGEYTAEFPLVHNGGTAIVTPPPHQFDIALRIIRNDK